MMHVSPCAWYCFQLTGAEEKWKVTDIEDKTLIEAVDGSCTIEVVAARKIGVTTDGEVTEIHERFLIEERIQPLKTMMSENPNKITTLVTRGIGVDERYHIVSHAFWKNFCAFVHYQGRREPSLQKGAQVFYDLLQSLQPLALD
jgi:hypothetical protein